MRIRLALCAILATSWTAVAWAEHANINLQLMRLDRETGQTREEVTAAADQEPPLGGINPRPLIKVKADEPLVLQFFLTNTYPHGENKDVSVHYFVVREEKARQKTVPDLTKGVVTEGRFTLTFKPKCRVGARVTFSVHEPGIYLLRVQTTNTNSDHEHFSAIDVQVE